MGGGLPACPSRACQGARGPSPAVGWKRGASVQPRQSAPAAQPSKRGPPSRAADGQPPVAPTRSRASRSAPGGSHLQLPAEDSPSSLCGRRAAAPSPPELSRSGSPADEASAAEELPAEELVGGSADSGGAGAPASAAGPPHRSAGAAAAPSGAHGARRAVCAGCALAPSARAAPGATAAAPAPWQAARSAA